MGDEPLRVLIVDDHAVYRAGLRAQFIAAGGVEVVGEASTADEAVLAARTLRPSLILMDLRLPRANGHEVTYQGVTAIKQIRHDHPEIVIVALTMYADDDQVAAALSAGANGFLVKERDDTDIMAKLLVAMDGTTVISGGVMARLRDVISTAQSTSFPFPALTPQQRTILEYIVAGLGNDPIAHRMCLSPKTIRNNTSLIFQKIGVCNRAELIAKARDAGVKPRL
ncbi:DNA-binding NarL/FixJ family response regulator [Kibdelosporangium banguiense]|uniref:DNA-binding NarL/FixJ family response regulator n=1 Tax=Kibdelosporangium banguiense TaxID=1365924 RepID=A0ABS4TSF1_9PSEU|nr:response regulator transcription factor [Kibdelosporangium banguiense]MBP2327327.1 DNA-binding NarL/FixJ family response regulator [Kibdelosporangium banguiense]